VGLPSGTDLLDAARDGDRRALARLITTVERGGDEARSVGRAAHQLSGSAHTVGITGAPGAGKSTLTNKLVSAARKEGLRTAVLAIDPSSPFTGGAVLGDRVRMGEHSTDDGVFIRSMATRGHLGGLSLAAPEAVRVLDAVGFAWILLETVGVGQVEVEVAGRADTTVVVVNPGWGDAVQAAKAGLMEVADLFVINKADRAGVEDTRRDLEQMLDLSPHPAEGESWWRPPILKTCAESGEGVPELWQAVEDHRGFLLDTGGLERRRAERRRRELDAVVHAWLEEEARRRTQHVDRDEVEQAVDAGDLDPWTAAERLLGPLAPPEP
jgi:LAO/AO transport system kinase